MKIHWKTLAMTAAAVNILCFSGCKAAQSIPASAEDLAETTKNIKISQKAAPETTSNTSGTSFSDARKITPAGAYELSGGSAAKKGEQLTATGENKSAVLVKNSGKLSGEELEITCSSKTTSNEESLKFGLGAALLADSSANVELKKGSVSSAGGYCAAVFATGISANISLSGTKISSAGENAPAICASRGGFISAVECEISSTGTNAPAVFAVDKNSTISVLSGKISAQGTNAPAVLSKGMVNINSAAVDSKSVIASIDAGEATFTAVTATGAAENGIELFSSGKATVPSSFTMNSGSLKNSGERLFYVTNSKASIYLNNVSTDESQKVLLLSESGKYGEKNKNGGQAVFSAGGCRLFGEIKCDMFSTVDIELKNGSVFKGAVNSVCSAKEARLEIDAGSTWELTADSYLTVFRDYLSQLTNIKDNGFSIYYDKNNKENDWLEGKTIPLPGGGKITPDLSRGQST
ncbi:MAG: hypothetical protein JG769_1620 [Oscillospiraceae bacterium]|jgi:hypothetical protein|nr:hypothetical protein [Oscillospiraceae bacterium]